MHIGALHLGDDGTQFTVWAPHRDSVQLRLLGPNPAVHPLSRGGRGYWHVSVAGVRPGDLYTFLLDGDAERPDPASHHQPRGVHGPSRVVDHGAFPWSDRDWRGIDQADLVFYELHVGTFTPEGTLDAVIPRLPALRELGVTALELMPVAQFPGERNWGYDGVYPFAVQDSYGGPAALKRLVDACHGVGMAVFLDVVYNHLGPEGNYLAEFGPYFTDRYLTPWGAAINFDGPWSDEVRNYFLRNALHWLEDYHLDGLRLDAVHAIHDESARPFLQQLGETVDALGRDLERPLHLVAESNRNDVRLVRSRNSGGQGLHAEWCDDFHHSLHALLSGERSGYYVDFGELSHLAKAYAEGYVYSGQFSRYRLCRHGSRSADLPGERFVLFAQNHDQVGNRMRGERLSSLVGFEAQKLAAGATLLAPSLPLLFMGEEYGEEAPFLYFVHHGDADLVAAVRRGRAAEFASFAWQGESPDPQAPETFYRSRLDWQGREHGRHAALLALYRELLRLRRELPALASLDRAGLDARVLEGAPVLALHRWHPRSRVLCLLHFGAEVSEVHLPLTTTDGPPPLWRPLLDTADTRWEGPGSTLPDRPAPTTRLRLAPWSLALFEDAQA